MSLFKPTHAALSAPTSPPTSALRLPLAALALTIPFAASAQTIYRATEKANPGQEITVIGDGLATVTQLSLRRYDAAGALGAPFSVAIKEQTASGIVAKLPDNVPLGVYSLTATDVRTSNAVLINAPRVQWIDSTEAMPDGTVRLVGRNLKPGAAAPTVRFVDTRSGASLPGVVTAAGDYDVTVRVPSTVGANRTYRVVLNSNVAGAASETTADETFNARPKGADPFALGTAWAADFAPIAGQVFNLKTDPRLPRRASGNGVADDAPALQAAIDAVCTRGGGVVYLPAGTYRIDNGTMLKLSDRVVLKGDGAGRTILEVGYRFSAKVSANPDVYAFQFQAGRNMGITALTFRNRNASAVPNGIMRGGNTAGTTNRSFLKNVDFEINNGNSPSLGRVREGAVQGCRFVSTSTKAGPLYLPNARYLSFTGNTVDYRVGRTWLFMGSHNVIENNTIRVDNTYRVPGSVETGGVELSYGQAILFSNNTVAGYGVGATKGTVDGEMIMAQAGATDLWDAGKVASVQGLRLVPVGKSWAGSWLSPYADDLDRSYVAITRGKGMGQWRRVASHDATSLTVDRAWDVVPDATSTFSVGALIAHEQTWIGNQVQNGGCGMMLWNGGIDCAMSDNTLTNTGGVVVRGSAQFAPTSTAVAQNIAWDVSVRQNTILNSTNKAAATFNVTGCITYPVAGLPSLGSLVLGVSGVDNVVVGNYFHGTGQLAQNDGIELLGFQEKGLALPADTVWGVTLVGNQISGSLLKLRTFNVSLKGVTDSLLDGLTSAQR